MTEKTKSLIVALILGVLAAGSIIAEHIVSEARKPEKNIFEGRTLRCVIDLHNDLRNKGLHGGLNYELLECLAAEKGCSITITRAEEDWRDSLEAGSLDLAVLEKNALTDSCIVIYPDSMAVWVMHKDSVEVSKKIREWLSRKKKDGEYYDLREKYSRRYNPFKSAHSGEHSTILSPYDETIRHYADSIGWDWRLVSAVIYNESKFSILSGSNAGASGLMQIMPSLAGKYQIDNLLDPKKNIKAGTRHLSSIEERYRKAGYSEKECLNFTLAAYNAGIGRIHDCICLADALGFDKKKWDDIVEVIPFMSKLDSLDCSDTVRLGTFKGTETINFVKNVLATYEAMCKIAPLEVEEDNQSTRTVSAGSTLEMK